MEVWTMSMESNRALDYEIRNEIITGTTKVGEISKKVVQ